MLTASSSGRDLALRRRTGPLETDCSNGTSTPVAVAYVSADASMSGSAEESGSTLRERRLFRDTALSTTTRASPST